MSDDVTEREHVWRCHLCGGWWHLDQFIAKDDPIDCRRVCLQCVQDELDDIEERRAT